ncbi:MAG: Co2+/Mg2+ efflux protein ApaG [Rhodospirillales bacterium]|nr:Co2+/Mg2+ efflux protein ApaG [Rhodospirillales bacterium]
MTKQTVSSEQGLYVQTTNAITVTVEPVFLADQSSAEDDHFVWAYHVRIENNGVETVQLLSRYWQITDSNGRVQEVRGDGVVGEQPVLSPGEHFEYTSGTPLQTSSGIMLGTYYMLTQGGKRLEVEVPAFSLDSPHHRAKMN